MRTLVLLAFGCVSAPDNSPEWTTTDEPTVPSVTVDTAAVSELQGEIPEVALPSPEFTARHWDGTERTREDLEGHLTVLWFFPFVNTPG